MRPQATESLSHAAILGEEVTHFGARVSLGIEQLLGVHHDSVDDMMEEMLLHERRGIAGYEELLSFVEGRDVSLEELTRQVIRNEPPGPSATAGRSDNQRSRPRR